MTAAEKWYSVDLDLDAEIKHRFEPAWRELMQGRYGLWLTYPSGLGYGYYSQINFRAICFVVRYRLFI